MLRSPLMAMLTFEPVAVVYCGARFASVMRDKQSPPVHSYPATTGFASGPVATPLQRGCGASVGDVPELCRRSLSAYGCGPHSPVIRCARAPGNNRTIVVGDRDTRPSDASLFAPPLLSGDIERGSRRQCDAAVPDRPEVAARREAADAGDDRIRILSDPNAPTQLAEVVRPARRSCRRRSQPEFPRRRLAASSRSCRSVSSLRTARP